VCEAKLQVMQESSTLFLHGVCMLRECRAYIWWVCTRAAP